MPRKPKHKQKVMKVETDLESFKAEEKKDEESKEHAAQEVNQAKAGLNRMLAILKKDMETSERQDLRSHLYYMDNKLIDFFYSHKERFTSEERGEQIDREAFLLYTRLTIKELQYFVNLPFIKFWAEIVKDSQIIDFLDDFLLNVRKHNDVYKLQVAVELTVLKKKGSKVVDEEYQGDVDVIRDQWNQLLQLVLKMFYRLSQPVESEQDQFDIEDYRELIYSNYVFDMAKLYDIVATFGESNPDTVKQIVSRVFENDKRYVQDFGDSVGQIIAMLKKTFSTSLKISDMVAGDAVLQRTRSEQDDIIKRLLLDMIEIMANVELTTNFFPESLIDNIRNTSLPLFMANVYCLMVGPVKKLWLIDSQIKLELEAIQSQVKKIAVQTCLTIVNQAIIKHINVHNSHYAVVQNNLAGKLEQFILGVTGKDNLSKETLHLNQNFMNLDDGKNGCAFLRKVMQQTDPKTGERTVNLAASLDQFEDRFMSQEQKELLLMILDSLEKGKQIQVQKTVVKSAITASEEQNSNLTLHDKENIKQIQEMFADSPQSRSKKFIENLYIANNKNMAETVNMFLSNEIPEDEKTELKVIETRPKVEEKPIDTEVRADKMRAYVLDEFKDILFPDKKKSKYEVANEKYLERQRREEEAEEKEARKRILYLANNQDYQYDDDPEESKVMQRMKLDLAPSAKPQKPEPVPEKKQADGEEEDEDLDDLLLDDPAAFIERQSSVEVGAELQAQFIDDPKATRREKELAKREEEKKLEESKQADSKRDGRRNEADRGRGRNDRGGRGERGRDDRGRGRGGDGERKPARGRGDHNRGGRGRVGDQKRHDGDGEYERPSTGRGRGRGRGERQVRGGYDDGYQREQIDLDNDYTTQDPLKKEPHYQANSDSEEQNQAQNHRGRGGRGRGNRGRGRGNSRGGHHDHKNKALKKTGP